MSRLRSRWPWVVVPLLIALGLSLYAYAALRGDAGGGYVYPM